MPLRPALALALLAVGLLADPALAETRRVAVVAGSNVGGPADKPLRWAEEDAAKVADVLAQLGDVAPEDLFLVKGRGRKGLEEALGRASQRVALYRQTPTDRTVLLFYYSGHSDEDALELAGDRLPYADLRRLLAATRSDVRVVIVDGCKSGALVQRKGGTRAPAFEISLADQLDATGEALLTSSAADELALESAEIRGSFFTNHLVSGLRGAADASGDGRITLAEAYQYAFDHTLAATASTGVRQHPGYDYRLSGTGELVLTEVTQPSASLELPDGFERALVLLVRRDQVLAELSGGGPRRVALGPGEYAVRVWKGTQAYAARVTLAAGETRAVGWTELARVASPTVANKGHAAGDGGELDDLTPEARVEYLEKYFTVEDALVVTTSGAAGHATGLNFWETFRITRGQYRKKIDEGQFFDDVGRPDLASSYRARRTAKWGLALGGIGVATVGALVAVTTTCGDTAGPLGPVPDDSCFRQKGRTFVATTLVGLSMMTVSFFIPLHPAETDEVRRLADQYNQGLHRRLGAPPSGTTTARGGEVQIAPALLPGGAGLTVGFTF